jgi:5'-nucleotidase
VIGSLLAAALAAATAVSHGGRCIEIVGTGDLHGHVAQEKWSEGGRTREGGGLALLGGYLKVLRQRHNPVLLLDSGDLFQGTLESNISHGRAVIAGYNALGYQAAVLGNHEFDFGAETPDTDLLAAVRHRVTESQFPFLAANVRMHGTAAPLPWRNIRSTLLIDLHGTTVGLIGLSHPDTRSLTLEKNVEELDFLPGAAIVLEQARQLRADGASLVVLVAHVGGECTVRGGGAGEQSCDQGMMRGLLHELAPGTVDVALAGHTHQYMSNWIAGVATIEAGFAGRDLAWATACAKAGGGIDRKRSELHPLVPILAEGEFLGKRVAPDPVVQRALQPYLDRVAAEAARPLGPVLPEPLVRAYDSPSSLGTVAAEALRRYTNADVALLNAGGLRADLPAGPLTFGALYRALPFENRPVVINVNGRELLALLNALPKSKHGFPQISGLVPSGDAGAWSGGALSDGRPLDLEGSYQLATVDFLSSGGDGLKPVVAKLSPDAVQEPASELMLRDIVLRYLRTASPAGPDGGQ